ncbi:tetratricopeptide repeat protein [Bdellovibrio sp. HCB2-146]|uniref:tetratricopeptide repeat protein n=1 Tax=Bdellovibrio sp. HCB2-146 TaxID=3394362 RepID=UPI0039BC4FAC
MKLGLYFNHSLIIVFLSFVSFWANAQATAPTTSQVKPLSTLQTAQDLFNKGEYAKTTTLLWGNIDQLDRQGLLLLVKAHEKKKEPGDMARAANILIGKNEKDFEAHTFLGSAFLMQKKTKDAIESYKRALELNSKYEPAYMGLANIFEMREPPNLYELRALYQDMIDNIGPRPVYLSKMCEISAKDSTCELAIRSCKEAIQKDTSIASNHVYLAVCLKATGEENAANETFKKTAAKFKNSEVAQYHYAKVLEEQKNYIDAMKFYKAATEADAKAARSWLGLATTSFEIRKFDVALIAYKNACKFDKKTAAAFRKATTILRNSQNSEWSGKFESASENCTF